MDNTLHASSSAQRASKRLQLDYLTNRNDSSSIHQDSNHLQVQMENQNVQAHVQCREHTKFGPINSRNSILASPTMNDLSSLIPIHAMPMSPMNELFSNRLVSPPANNLMFEAPKLPIVQPITMMNDDNNGQESQSQYNELTNCWQQTMMNYNSTHRVHEGLKNLPAFDLPPSVIKKENNVKHENNKRKIKTESDYDNDDSDFIVGDESKSRRKKRKRGRKSKVKLERESFRNLLDQSMQQTREVGFVGIKNDYGEVKITVPVQSQDVIKYDVFGHACTEKIEDILQPKKRTRYVRGLDESSKKDRRREQNRNAAARSRARKNAMIAKVIQLHQENLALRAHVSSTIRQMSALQGEKERLQSLPNLKL